MLGTTAQRIASTFLRQLHQDTLDSQASALIRRPFSCHQTPIPFTRCGAQRRSNPYLSLFKDATHTKYRRILSTRLFISNHQLLDQSSTLFRLSQTSQSRQPLSSPWSRQPLQPTHLLRHPDDHHHPQPQALLRLPSTLHPQAPPTGASARNPLTSIAHGADIPVIRSKTAGISPRLLEME